ncbi:glycosyl hydrolase family 3 N terminal domain-containing protein [Xylaria curta]|nr:glycosyl hydrolase family 3 N terminal domain-containing protein [Xylaria curta]
MTPIESTMGKGVVVGLVFSLLVGSQASTHNGQQWLRGSPTNDSVPAYRNPHLSVETRVDDLLQRMTLEEKAGQLMNTYIGSGPNGTLDEATIMMIDELQMTHLAFLGNILDPVEAVEFHNRLQQLALNTRLGIPITVATDSRHHVGPGFIGPPALGYFSQWPGFLGFAALRDPELVRKHAEIAREEFLSIGFRLALHPYADISTEPRWARIAETFGESAELSAELIVPYIEGLQGKEFGPHSMSTTTNKFPGGGPMQHGWDSHFTYGMNETYPGNNMDYHLISFKAAIAAGTRQMLPYYSRPINTEYESVGFGYNKGIVTNLLKEQLGFDGIVLTDFGLITGGEYLGQVLPARAWGVENLTDLERAAKILDAGCDQFGGEARPELIVQLVREGTVLIERIDYSVRKLLKEKFLLGLFDNPFISAENAVRVSKKEEFHRLGFETQRRAYTLLTNRDDILPLSNQKTPTKFYIEGFNASFIESRGHIVVATAEEADFALLRLQSPFEPRPGGFEATFHQGSLEFSDEEKARQAAIYKTVPTIVDMQLDRPAAIPEIADQAVALLASFGAVEDAFLDVIFGLAGPEGKLPYDLPRSDMAVEANLEDVPFDTKDPVFKFGHGLRYNRTAKSS